MGREAGWPAGWYRDRDGDIHKGQGRGDSQSVLSGDMSGPLSGGPEPSLVSQGSCMLQGLLTTGSLRAEAMQRDPDVWSCTKPRLSP